VIIVIIDTYDIIDNDRLSSAATTFGVSRSRAAPREFWRIIRESKQIAAIGDRQTVVC